MSATKALLDAVKASCVEHPLCSKRRCTKQFSRDGASFSLGKAPIPHLVVDFDAPGSPLEKNDPRCDFLFVSDGSGASNGHVAPIEMSSGKKKASKVREQLQAGTDFVEAAFPSALKVNFRPVLVGKLTRSKKARRDSKAGSGEVIRFRQTAYKLEVISSGSTLFPP